MTKICLFYIKYVLSCPKYVIYCQKYVHALSKICLSIVKNMYEYCQKYVTTLSKVCNIYVKLMIIIFQKYATEILKIFNNNILYVQSMSKICSNDRVPLRPWFPPAYAECATAGQMNSN